MVAACGSLWSLPVDEIQTVGRGDWQGVTHAGVPQLAELK